MKVSGGLVDAAFIWGFPKPCFHSWELLTTSREICEQPRGGAPHHLPKASAHSGGGGVLFSGGKAGRGVRRAWEEKCSKGSPPPSSVPSWRCTISALREILSPERPNQPFPLHQVSGTFLLPQAEAERLPSSRSLSGAGPLIFLWWGPYLGYSVSPSGFWCSIVPAGNSLANGAP